MNSAILSRFSVIKSASAVLMRDDDIEQIHKNIKWHKCACWEAVCELEPIFPVCSWNWSQTLNSDFFVQLFVPR